MVDILQPHAKEFAALDKAEAIELFCTVVAKHLGDESLSSMGFVNLKNQIRLSKKDSEIWLSIWNTNIQNKPRD